MDMEENNLFTCTGSTESLELARMGDWRKHLTKEMSEPGEVLLSL